jgi:hypothetical protein
MLLTKEVGLNLRDIRGWRERSVRTEKRRDFVAAVQRWLPWCNDPDSKQTVETTNVRGLSEDQVMRMLVLHDEHEQIKEEEAEKERKRARRKTGGLNNSPE